MSVSLQFQNLRIEGSSRAGDASWFRVHPPGLAFDVGRGSLALAGADEIFLTGTAAEVTPIREVDGIQIGPGKPGPVTQKMQKLYAEVVRGKHSKYSEWLTPTLK